MSNKKSSIVPALIFLLALVVYAFSTGFLNGIHLLGDSSIKLLVLYDILLKSTDEEHALSTNEIIEELKKRGISVSRKVLPSDIDLLNKYGYEICSYVKKSRYYWDEGTGEYVVHCTDGTVAKDGTVTKN